MIVFCSFMIHVLGPALLLSLSVMYVAWLEEFDTSRSLTSWAVSLSVAMFLCVGPLASSVAHRFGNQATVVTGSLIFFLGFSLCQAVTSVNMLIVCIGFVSGVGCGFTYLPAIASVAVYFDKRRSLAMGIATSGTGIGSFVMAPVYHWLILTYGWRGTLLITGAFQLNLCALGLLMKPLTPTGVDQHQEDLTLSESLLHPEGNDAAQRFTSSSEVCADHMTYQVVPANRDLSTKPRGGSMIHLAPNSHSPYCSSRAFASATELDDTSGQLTNHLALDVMMTGSVHSLSMIDRNGTFHPPHTNGTKPSASSSSLHTPDLTKDEKPGGCLDVFLSIFTNFSLLKIPDFFVFIVSNVLTNLSFLMPVLYMVDRAIDSGLDPASSAVLVSVYGAGNVIGRLVCGFVGDRNILDRTLWYVLDLAVCGLATCLSPLSGDSRALHGLYALTFGTTIGAFTTMVPMVTVDIVGVSLVGQAYGVVLLFSGLPGALGPPLAGFVFDLTGDFTASFVLHGVFVLLSALVLLPVVCCKQHKN